MYGGVVLTSALALYANTTTYNKQMNLQLSPVNLSHLKTQLHLTSISWRENHFKFYIHYLFMEKLPLGGSVVSRSLLTVKSPPGLVAGCPHKGFIVCLPLPCPPATHAPSSANATPEFEGRGGEELGMELSNTLYKVFNNKHSVDLKGLCISAGEHCWVLYVDVLVS